MNRYVCIHGHFYQPPRENPWLEEVETQESAAPYHDWNERVTAECYRPNAWSRVLDADGRIVRIVNNYARISFNVGPTLLSWLERHAPKVYGAILAADKTSRERFSGHGSAIAQAYNHLILPLASRRDKETQVAWGVRDFTARFGRAPEGMWLPETAADPETLDVVAAAGIRFTILSPYQAARFRPRGAAEWITPAPGEIPSTRAFETRTPSGRSLALFFYNGGLSSDIAFKGLLNSGTAFGDRLATAFDGRLNDEAQLVHVATDGETYGHHHRHGDMALADALEQLDARSDVALTNYGEFLERHPPTHEVEIHAPSAWSCAHGVERWRSNCGCNSNLHPGWSQEWRTPLRGALDWLRDALVPAVDEAAPLLFRDPTKARHEYEEVLRDRSEAHVTEFLTRHAGRVLDTEETIRALRLLEIERHLQQMYTSCGWFFDDLAGIETVQVLQYASRAIQLGEQVFGRPLETEFTSRLAAARSNRPELGDGRAVYERWARTVRIELREVCAHYAFSSLFEEYPDPARVYCFTVHGAERRTLSAGSARLVLGQARFRSEITRAADHFTYGALLVPGPSLFGGVRPFQSDAAFQDTARELVEAFERADLPETIRRVDRHFGEGTYTLRLLFHDEQAKFVGLLFESMRESVENAFRGVYESTAPILKSIAASGAAAPRALRTAAEFFLNERIHRALDHDPPDVAEVAARVRELATMNLPVDGDSVSYPWGRAAEQLMDRYARRPSDAVTLRSLTTLVELAQSNSLEVDLSQVQNRYYEMVHPTEPAGPQAQSPPHLATEFRLLGERLRVHAS
ncbi:MAG: DUF3536 domain-containing protein [Thermoplasmata archaeon]